MFRQRGSNDLAGGFYRCPRETTFGAIWRGVDTSAVDELGRTELIRATLGGCLNLRYAVMLVELDTTNINI